MKAYKRVGLKKKFDLKGKSFVQIVVVIDPTPIQSLLLATPAAQKERKLTRFLSMKSSAWYVKAMVRSFKTPALNVQVQD